MFNKPNKLVGTVALAVALGAAAAPGALAVRIPYAGSTAATLLPQAHDPASYARVNPYGSLGPSPTTVKKVGKAIRSTSRKSYGPASLSTPAAAGSPRGGAIETY